ncbi:TonB C-terminal domain-containing protein [Pseudoluteimonas lycopersici]|uniref:TonB C-terminal domain-containing protein n=2 Tax=Pseudoluteimonas lycopersici TaxID=1324796 RepID=A0A516V8J8_9GAMM|nr:TonB C-terminal domain-containing protein [Lysobacter lycopersici]
MYFGLWWTRQGAPQESWGVPVQAEVIDANALSPSLQRALKREAVKPPPPPPTPEEKSLPEPLPEETPPPPQPRAQEQLPEPDAVDQEEVRRDAVSPDTRLREQEAKQRQQQVDLDEQERQKQEQQQKQREILARLEQVKAQRALAKRAADQAAARLQQLADWKAQQASDAAASASPPPGNPDADNGLKARYAAALTQAIRSNWTRPDNVPLSARCVINITQLPGGKVIDVQVSPSCPYDALGKRSVEAAVLKAQPLPYAGFESVFKRQLELHFQAEDN